jgi:tetratricopeptide (TPR) repeat protein
MKRLLCLLLFCSAALCLASSGLAQMTNAAATTNDALPPPPPATANLSLVELGTNAASASPLPLAETKLPVPVMRSPAAQPTNPTDATTAWEDKIQQARELRHQKDFTQAAQTLELVLKADVPAELHRQALFERALVAQDNGQPVKAQQIWGQYLHLFSSDPSVPDVLLRQGVLYRDMGVHTLAISKFYAVMSSALKLQLGNMDYYKKLVVQAQTYIAETYYLDARFEEAADFYNRILIAGEFEADREQLECKLIRALSHLTNSTDYVNVVGRAQTFLGQFPNSGGVPEVRFMLASALTKVGRNQDSMRQVLLLLQAEQDNVVKDPQTWFYWQRQAGNEIANQLYKQGDYLDALQIYLSLAELDKSPTWQIPVWYQTGLDYEQLQQWQMATDTYARIMDRQKELNDTNSSPMLSGIIDMAKWRRDYIAWEIKARDNTLALHYTPPANAAPVVAP